MSKLLINETPLQVLPTLARRIGLHEAIVLQQIHFLSMRAGSVDGWVEKTVDEWGHVFVFMSKRSLERAFTNLRKLRLLETEYVATKRGRQSRVRIDHDILAGFEGSRQDGGTGPAKMAEGSRQDGGTPSCNKETAEETTEQSSSNSVSVGDSIDVVWSVWIESTQPTGTVLLTAKRRRIIRRAIDSHGLDDCTAAVRGWQHSPHHRGENKDRRVYNSIELLLRDAEHVEMFRDLERRHGGGGNVAGDCPGPTPPRPLIDVWAAMTAHLVDVVPETQHSIWITPLHVHGEHDGRLVLAAPQHICTWVSDRYMEVLEQAADGRKVTVVQCDLAAT